MALLAAVEALGGMAGRTVLFLAAAAAITAAADILYLFSPNKRLFQ